MEKCPSNWYYEKEGYVRWPGKKAGVDQKALRKHMEKRTQPNESTWDKITVELVNRYSKYII